MSAAPQTSMDLVVEHQPTPHTNQHTIEAADQNFDGDGSAYFRVHGHFGSHGPHVFAAAPKLLVELKKARALIAEHLDELCASCTNATTGMVDDPEELMAIESEQDLLNSISAAIAAAEGN